MDPPLGSIVEVPVGRGVVRFSGSTQFSAGKWIGIELNEPNGKNDGTVQGIPYFTCRAKYGVFVRPSQIKEVIGHERDLIKAKPLATPGHKRTPSSTAMSGHKRTPSSSLLVRSNSNRTTGSTPSPRAASPAKPPPTKVVLTRPGIPGTASPSKRTSLGPPPTAAAPRKSIPIKGSPPDVSSPAARSESPYKVSSSPVTSSPLASSPPTSIVRPPSRPPSSLGNVFASRPSLGPAAEIVSPSRPPPPDESELQELRAKIRVLEAKRTDDSQRIRELETRLSEAEAFVAIRPKLQAKLTSLQTDLTEARRDLSDAQQLHSLSEGRMVDAQEQLEMAMLDKEVAEERAELAESELEDAKERLAILEVELEVMKEGAELEDDDPEDGKGTRAYIQLEKHNERLKDALIRLRDITQETEIEQRRRISDLEKDLIGIDDLQCRSKSFPNYETTQIKLANAEIQIEDLKMQLDDALGAEDVLVQLTERNLMLSEKIEEMRITIEDLEALKELNDELEENHIETEKGLYEDLEAKEAELRDRQRTITQLEDLTQDLEGTISQFRDLVLEQQSELNNLRSTTESAQTQSEAAKSQAATVMSLNLRLQSSASKNQARIIELEIKRLEAKEAHELLNIVQPYLPSLYVESDMDATSCYLFFQRVGAKVDLINTIVAQIHNLPDSLAGEVSDVLVGVCELRSRLSGLSTLCRRFAAIMRKCDVDTFLNVGKLYVDLAPMEKRIDIHVDLLRRDEFREMECASDINKISMQFEHLAETYFSGFEYDIGEREFGHLASFDHDLDMFSAAMGWAKTSVGALAKDEDMPVDLGGYDIDEDFLQPVEKLLEQCKPAKSTSKKILKRLEDLSNDGAVLKSSLIPQMQALANLVPDFTNFGINLAQTIMPLVADARASKTSFQLAAVLGNLKSIVTSTVAKDLKPGVSPWDAAGDFISRLVQEVGKILPSAMEQENIYKISGVAPWVARVNEIKASTAVNVEAEHKLAQMSDEMQGLLRTLKSKDQHIQESSVKIELLDRRMEAAKKQGDSIVELETELSKTKKQGKAYEQAIEQLQADLDSLEQENAKLKTAGATLEKQAPGVQIIEAESVPIEGSLETSYLLEQIEAFRGTVRYLRTENTYLKGQDLLRELEALPELPMPSPPTPPLVPSGLSDTEEESDDELVEGNTYNPTLRSLATETKVLYRDVLRYSSSPKVVDLSMVQKRREQAANGKTWLPRKKTPAYQVYERKMRGERLKGRVQDLLERASVIDNL
ncbi:dynactin [Flagelloscypha sp. PMI_526]|nr:dynactin [Flagelloscypha sp. PMI_526]